MKNLISNLIDSKMALQKGLLIKDFEIRMWCFRNLVLSWGFLSELADEHLSKK